MEDKYSAKMFCLLKTTGTASSDDAFVSASGQFEQGVSKTWPWPCYKVLIAVYHVSLLVWIPSWIFYAWLSWSR